MFERETINKLYLELSQFVDAKTEKELRYETAIERALFFLKDATPKDRNGPCVRAIDVLKTALGRPTDYELARNQTEGERLEPLRKAELTITERMAQEAERKRKQQP